MKMALVSELHQDLSGITEEAESSRNRRKKKKTTKLLGFYLIWHQDHGISNRQSNNAHNFMDKSSIIDTGVYLRMPFWAVMSDSICISLKYEYLKYQYCTT